MNNSWKQSKCSSTWPSSPFLPPLQLPTSSAPRNQMDVNVGSYIWPYLAPSASSMECTVISEPMVLNTLNLGSCKSNKPELGNFLALLSGPPQQLQYDFQQLSNPKIPVAASKLPVHNSSILINGDGCGVPVIPVAALPHLHGNEIVGSRGEPCPGISTRMLPTSTCNAVSALHKNPNSHLSGPNPAKHVLHHSIHGNDVGMEVSSLRLGRLAREGPANDTLFHATNIKTSPGLPSEVQSTSSVLPPTFPSAKLRVSCLATSGDLLLSDTGFLGIVCSCHGLRMSVAKFCEHAGCHFADPGDAVHFESGETIAQWFRACFFKFGMKVPDDINGWDWPLGFSAPGGLVLGRSSIVSNMPKNSNTFQQVDSFGAFMRSGQPYNDFTSPNNSYEGQFIVEKPVNVVMHNGPQKNALVGGNIAKSLVGATLGNLPFLADNQILHTVKECSTSISRSSQDKAEKDNGYPSVVDCVDFISKGGNPFIVDPNFRISKSFGVATNINHCNSSRDAFVMDMDGAVPSNIELRLGQPSQQSCTLGGSTLPSMRPQPVDSLFDISKSQFSEPLVHRAINPKVTEESKQNLFHAPSDSISSGKEKDDELDLVYHALRSLSTMDPAKLERLKVDATKSSLISLFLSHFNNPLEGDIQSHVPKPIDTSVNSIEHCVPKVLGSYSHNAKCDLADFPSNKTDGMGNKLNVNGLVLSNPLDKGKDLKTVSDNCYAVANPTSSFHKQLADADLSARVLGGHCLQSSSAMHDKPSTLNLHRSTVVHADATDTGIFSNQYGKDASDARCFSNQYGKAPCFRGSDHLDHVLRSGNAAATVTALSGLFTLTTPVGGLTSSNLINLSNERSNDASPHVVDENSSLLALKHIIDLPKQDTVLTTLETIPEKGPLLCSPVLQVRGKSPKEVPLAYEELREGSHLKKNGFELSVRPLQSCCNNCTGNYRTGDGFENSPHMAGGKNCCNVLTSKQRTSFCSKELGAQWPPCHDSGADEQPLLRLGRTENKDTTGSCEHGRFSEKESNPCTPGNCICAVHSLCSQICISRGKTLMQEHTECVGDKTLAFFNKDCVIQGNQSVLSDQGESWKRHFPQWRDVPSKVTGNCSSIHNERPVEVLDSRKVIEDQLSDTAAKGFTKAGQEVESLKEQQMSNVCSGYFAPVITEVSVGVNNADSCNMGTGRYAHELLVDEGSRIEKCGSSDNDLGGTRWAEIPTVVGKTTLNKEGHSTAISRQSSCDLIDEVKFTNSFKSKKARNRIQPGCSVEEIANHTRQFGRDLKAEKKQREMKSDSDFPAPNLSSLHYGSSNSTQHSELYFRSSEEIEMSLDDDYGWRKTRCIYTCGPSSLKRKRSALLSAKFLSSDLHKFEEYHREWEDDCPRSDGDIHLHRSPKHKISAQKKLKIDQAEEIRKHVVKQDVNIVDDTKVSKYMSIGSMKSPSRHEDALQEKGRPVVCGNSGIITNGRSPHVLMKPAKIASLRSILKVAKRCTLTKTEMEPRNAYLSGNKRVRDGHSVLNKDRDDGVQIRIKGNQLRPIISSSLGVKKASLSSSQGYDDGTESTVASKCGAVHGFSSVQMKPRFKQTRKRSLHELCGEVKHRKKPICLSNMGNDHFQTLEAGFFHNGFSESGKLHSFTKFYPRKHSGYSPQTDAVSEKSCLNDAKDSQNCAGELSQQVDQRFSIEGSKSEAIVLDSDAFCCVCGRSNKDEINCILECSCCLIRVHQACYGVSKAPKGHWCCRPCRTNSKNIACVLCGYGSGAMTRAIKSRNIVKSLLDAWKVEAAGSTESFMSISVSGTVNDDLGSVDPAIKAGVCNFKESHSVPVMRATEVESFQRPVFGRDLQNNIMRSSDSSCNFKVCNTITAGVLDPTVTQWVHMVCGLWTPGTRCPNVDTMSTFDVSGASHSKKKMVCSLCSRLGGSCIQCRVANCSIRFHPWCAHQKGLLQSEVEGAENEKIGFYGRCLLHAAHVGCHSKNHLLDAKTEKPKEKEMTCARTEGYKGRKREEGFNHNFHLQANSTSTCLVPQEQINAWLHINGQKSCIRGSLKPTASDIEHDCRKEYARYKHAKGWKHLVVYKSGIHALGLYTSQFIPRGAMVVEYVGEIVGLRLADKREIEYQSGRKVQYKSACYFFRIDKEHIIDATRKGGIARFVNHSCMPNCVAKVISVRNEKKVVFFAERDVNPGEEITYDYHFNHEDEGKKIPCFCNSKNCRRYLN